MAAKKKTAKKKAAKKTAKKATGKKACVPVTKKMIEACKSSGKMCKFC